MTWLSTAQAAERIGRPTKYVREAPDAVDAFVQGFDPPAQSRACGCAALRAVRRAG